MPVEESFRGKEFEVVDPDSRIRVSRDQLTEHARYATGDPLPLGVNPSDYKRIPKGTKVRIDEVAVIAAGSETQRVFALASMPDGNELGWTSTRNFAGQFRNETLGLILPAKGAGKYGATAAWTKGKYTGQIELVRIVSAELKVRQIALKTAPAYFDLVERAADDGIMLAMNSGFRSYQEQKYFYEGFKSKLPGFNGAALPGRSLHQSGLAFDLDLNAGDGGDPYDWLKHNATATGFYRSVDREPWHWEYDPATAEKLMAAGTFKTKNVLS